jgi:type I restriction enzyme S subunit
VEKQKCPVVRFSKFGENWEAQPLKNIFGKIRNAFVGTATPYYVKKGNFYLESNNVKDGLINRKTQIFIDDYFYFKQKDKWLKTGDLVMVQSGHVGHAAVIPEELNNSAAHALIMFSDYKVPTNPYFLNYQLQTNNAKSAIEKFTTGNTIRHILSSDMKEFLGFFTNFDEQLKVGEFFQNLDQSIALHEKKLAQTQNFKKAMLEKMFPKQGSKRPEIRLNSFRGDWYSSKLTDYISIKHGYAFNGEFFSDKETDYCLLTPGNFMIGGGFKAEKFIYYKGGVPKNYILKENDLIVTMTDLSKESDTLGLPALLPSIEGKILLHNQRLGLITFENLELEKEFLFYLLQTKSYHKYIVLSATGTTVKHTSPSKILGFTCKIPEPTEQKKIGGFFKKIDEKINLHQQQLQTLKNLKQAFLEKMFV